MEKKITELNNLYEPALATIELLCKTLNSKKIDYKLGFYNNHEIKVNNQFVKEFYPIPVISCKTNNIDIDIGIDLANDNNYIGFIELTLSKKDILSFDFYKLDSFDFEVYGLEDYLDDYYFGDLEKTKELINYSTEKKFHIGINIKNINQIKTFIQKIRG